jgi:hypothetical protein
MEQNKEKVNLVLLCNKSGTIHLFLLPSDKQMYAAISKMQELEKLNESWSWGNIIKQYLPTITMGGS